MNPAVGRSAAEDSLLPYRWILPVTTQGSALEHLAWQPAKRPDEVTLYEIDARAGFDQPAQITHTSIVRGIKGVQQQVQLSGMTAEELLAGVRQQMIGDTWQTIDTAQWRYDQKAQASVVISGTGMVGWDDDGDGARSLALPGGGFNPPERRVAQQARNRTCLITTSPNSIAGSRRSGFLLRLRQSNGRSSWAMTPEYSGKNHYRAFELRDGSIRMVRGLRVEQQEIDAESARKDNDLIAAFDNSMAWINYDPNGKQSPDRVGKGVSATFEIDWTADSVPCLATGVSP